MTDDFKPVLSVITVVYNNVDDIERTMLSVLGQTYPRIEYIVIDGASTDGTLDAISQHRDKLALLISEPDKGIYDAMNKGIALATGHIIGTDRLRKRLIIAGCPGMGGATGRQRREDKGEPAPALRHRQAP